MAAGCLFLFLLLLLLPLASTQTYHWGPCPSPQVQPNFKLEQYVGRWYEIAKLPAPYTKGKCIETDYGIRKDGTIQVRYARFHKDKMRRAEGTAIITDAREPAKLGVSYSYFTPYSPHWVLTTDYTSVSVVYSCEDYFRVFHVDYAWILGRSRFLPPDTVRYAQDVLIKEGVDLFRMTATDQTGCKED